MATTTKKGRGRPKKNTPEQPKVQKVVVPETKKDKSKKNEEEIDESVAHKDTPVESVESKKDSEEIEVKNESIEESIEDSDKNDEMNKSVQEFEIEDANVVDDYSPLNPEVIHRGYESGNAPITVNDSEDGIAIPEAELTFGDNEAEANKEKEAKASSQQSQQNTNTGSGQQSGGASPAATKPPSEQKSYWQNTSGESSDKPAQSNAEKRRNATKMADTLLMVYRDKLPDIFKFIAKFNEGKISRMELNGELDRNMPVLQDGTTVGQYIASVNAKVDADFVITDEQVLEVREPLIDFLMERDVEMSPSQRLMMAVGSHIISFGLTAIQRMQENRHAMNKFAEFHADWKGHGRGDIPSNRQEVKSDYAPEQNTYQEPVNSYEEPIQHNIMPENDEPDFEVVPDGGDTELNMDSFMNEENHSDDIPS